MLIIDQITTICMIVCPYIFLGFGPIMVPKLSLRSFFLRLIQILPSLNTSLEGSGHILLSTYNRIMAINPENLY